MASHTKAAPAAKSSGIKLYSPEYFAVCGLGGLVSCGVTHTAVTPIDLVKCNAQANPQQFEGFVSGFRAMYRGELKAMGFRPGVRGIFRGWGPTFLGYSAQGLGKFGFYEVFKHYYSDAVGEERAHKYRDLVYVSASASAEFLADLMLCPFEAVKVRVQTKPSFANGVMDGMPKFYHQEGAKSLYASLGPLWGRQIPYTVIKFAAFERIAEMIYNRLPWKKEEMTPNGQMGVIFAAGYLAGILCGAVSHPADTMVSKINKVQRAGGLMEKMRYIYTGTAEKPGIGFRGLWAGFWPRVVMIGTLTGFQWFIYGAFKSAFGLPTPGAGNAKADKKGKVASSH